ncbi:MAG: hypothetical protein ABWY82_25660 [Tardiphaga sp.]
MRDYPGVSRFVVRYVPRRGIDKDFKCVYTYYKARMWANGKVVYLGNYVTAQEAAAACARAKENLK